MVINVVIFIPYHVLPRYDPMINLAFIPSSAELVVVMLVITLPFPFQLLACLCQFMVTFLILNLYS